MKIGPVVPIDTTLQHTYIDCQNFNPSSGFAVVEQKYNDPQCMTYPLVPIVLQPYNFLFSDNVDTFEDPVREKRQVEIFDDEYPTAMSQNEQEEPGFWDRIVKVALKIFSKFIEWLNA